MPTVDALKSGISEQRREKADAAVRAFRQLQPTLTSYARMLTGRRDVRIEVAARDNGSTDGTVIYFRPPISLGDKTPHERRDCDRRGPDGRMICPACKIREAVLVTIYHEIAHICHDSFATTSDVDRRRAINFGIRETGGKYAQQVTERINKAPAYITSSYMGLARLINEHLPFLVNCLEDARVNAALFEVRPGVRLMFYVDTKEIFDDGFECMGADGQTYIQEWNKAPLNSQVMIGCFCKASGYKYDGWFHPKVEAALNDPQLTDLINTINHTSTIGGVFSLSFKVLARLRTLGFCGTPQDPDATEELSDESDGSDNQEVPDVSPEGENAEPADGGESSPGSDEGRRSEDSGAERPGEDEDDHRGSEDSSERSGEGSETDHQDGQEATDPDGGGLDGEEENSEGSSSGDSSDSESSDEAGEGSAGGDEGDSERASGGAEGSDDDSDGSPSGSSGFPSSDSSMGEDGDVELPPQADDSGVPNGDDGGHSEGGERCDLDAVDGDDPSTSSEGSDDQLRDADSKDSASEEHAGESGAGGGSDDDAEEPIDSGADDGYGGTRVESSSSDDPPMGDPADIDPIIKKWGQHEEKPKTTEDIADEQAIETSIIQGLYFTKPSKNIRGVTERHYDVPEGELGRAWARNSKPTKIGQKADLDVPESVLQPAVLHLRRAFTDNQIAAMQGNLKSGRVNRRVLGKRAWNDDERLFNKKKLPGRQDWFVIIGMDVSGSTAGKNIAIEKRVVFAQAEMLNRVGIPFAVYAHTGLHNGGTMDLEMYHIKDAKEPWNEKTQERLARIGPSSANLDGHALEFLRKRADEHPATDKIILYYSDGKMPLENYDEELIILRDEINLCKRKQYTLLGVGIRTDSPRAHGLDTVQVDSDDDLITVVKHLAKRIAGNF